MDTPKTELRQRLRELLSVPERERSDAVWDEIIELEIRLAPGNQIDPNRSNEPLGVNQNFRQPRQNKGHPGQQRKQGRRPNKGHAGGGGQRGGNTGGSGGGGGGGGGGNGGGNPPPSAQ